MSSRASSWQLRGELLHGGAIGTEPVRMASRGVKVSRGLEELVLSIDRRILSFGNESSNTGFIQRLKGFDRSEGLVQQPP